MWKGFAVLVAMAAVILSMTSASANASAGSVAVLCTGRNVITYSPGVTYEERTVQIEGVDTAIKCVDSPHPLNPPSSFTAPFSGTLTTSCASLFTGGGTGTQTLYWDTGETSYWDWTLRYSSDVNGQFVSTADGPITEGKYAGWQLRQVVTVATPDQTACFTSDGLKETSGPSLWVFTLG